MIAIRAHQLLCLQGFQGKGYSEAFTLNMQVLFNKLRLAPETLVLLTLEPSDLCSACPNLQNSLCAKDADAEQRMRTRDLSTLRKLKINHHSRALPFSTLLNTCSESFKRTSDLIDTCFDCQWQRDCLFFQSRKETIE